jgi:hypothetical protein
VVQTGRKWVVFLVRWFDFWVYLILQTTAPESSQPVTKISIRNLPTSTGRPAPKAISRSSVSWVSRPGLANLIKNWILCRYSCEVKIFLNKLGGDSVNQVAGRRLVIAGLDNAYVSTPHVPMGLHGLVQGKLYLHINKILQTSLLISILFMCHPSKCKSVYIGRL